MIAELIRALIVACCLAGAFYPLYAQSAAGDWTTLGNDAQRSWWLRGDPKISPASMSKPGFQLVWKVKLNNRPREMQSLTPPALLDFYIGYRGFRSLGFVGGSSEMVVAIDTDLARIEWEKNFASRAGASSLACPGGMTSSVARPTNIAYPSVLTARGFGRGGPAKSGVGEPFEGAVTLKERELRPPPPPPPPPKPGARNAAPPNPFAPRVQYVYAITGDGKLHSMYVSNGEEPKLAVEFLPPDAHAVGLMVFDNTAYAATVNGCGGVEDGIWALDLESKKVTRWKSPAPITGSAGFAVTPDGTLLVAAGAGLFWLEPKTLKQIASRDLGKRLVSSPLIFEHKGKDWIAVASREGRLHLVDAAPGGKLLHETASHSDADFIPGALASWQDAAGTRWLLAPAAGATVAGAGFAFTNGVVRNGAIAAWRLVENNKAPALEPGWVSRDLISPLTPAIVNGVIFALSSGEFRTRDPGVTSAQRAQRSSPAVLYALDAATGKELWNSGGTITSFVHSGGLAAGGSRVYVGAHDGTLYAFGFPMEH